MRSELPMATYSLFPVQAAIAKRVGAAEWSAPCPWCGGVDRFHIFAANGRGGDRYWCRVCGKKGFMDGNKHKLTPAEIEAVRLQRQQRREQERLEREARVLELEGAAYWRGYHDAMRDVGRDIWRSRGLPDEAQDWFEVGYTDYGGYGAALSIPFHNREWAVETVQYRLLEATDGGKYRFESGYPATPYWTRPPKAEWPTLICEGAIKGAVLFWQLAVENDRPYNVVSLTSKTPGHGELERLAEDVPDHGVYLILDPDATPDERARIGAFFDAPRYVSLPGKVDDLLVQSLITPAEIEHLFVRQATLEPI